MIARGLIGGYYRVIVMWGLGFDGIQGRTETTGSLQGEPNDSKRAYRWVV